MPLKNPDPFANGAEHLNGKVNPFVTLLRDSSAEGSLPLAFGPQLVNKAGRWRDEISAYHQLGPAPNGGRRPLVVEIGCHLGRTLLELAQAHPETLFIGIDITFKRVVTTAQRAQKLGLKNVYCALANAVAIEKLFAEGEVDGCLIFFPDPWVKKKRQAKNRLVNEAFATKLRSVLVPDGFCWFKTDQQLYFEEATAHFAAAGLSYGQNRQPALLGGGDFTSTFEQRFQQQGLATFGNTWVRPSVVS